MKRSSGEPLIENVGEAGCLESAFKQNTNDDDELQIQRNVNHEGGKDETMFEQTLYIQKKVF